MLRNAPQREQAFEQAIEDLEKGVFNTIAAAARAYNLDRTTLSRRIKGTTKRSAAHSEQQALSPK
jgi:DNA invertase Pin-like site-specific DNA recombinase